MELPITYDKIIILQRIPRFAAVCGRKVEAGVGLELRGWRWGSGGEVKLVWTRGPG